ARFASLRSAPLVGRSRSHARCPYRARCRCGDHCLSHGGADHARPAFAPPARPGAHRRPGNRHRGHRRPAAATVRPASLMLSTCSEGEKHCGGARSRIQPGDVGFDRSRSVSDGASVDDCEELDSASSVIVVFIAGCASEDRPLRDWNLDVDGGPQRVAVRLPASLIDKLPLRETPFTLRAELSLVPNERGYPLTLVFYSFDGLRGVSIDGWSARDEDDTAVSEHPFVIPAERTRRSTLSIIVTARESFRDFAFGVPAAPRVAAEDNSGAATGRLLEGPR